MTARQTFTFPPVNPEYIDPEIQSSASLRAEYAAAMPHTDPCHQNCDGPEGQHPVTWRLHPRPGSFPKPDAITSLVECCTCCAWGCHPEGFVARLERERFDDHDIEIERLLPDGRWVRFEQRFEGAA
jgi:hypothetical protein